jgi:hypothetical protein
MNTLTTYGNAQIAKMKNQEPATYHQAPRDALDRLEASEYIPGDISTDNINTLIK